MANVLQSYVQIILERGVLLAASKLFGSDKRIIRMFNRGIKPGRYDDGQWHSVVLYRDLRVVSLFASTGWVIFGPLNTLSKSHRRLELQYV